MAIFHLSMKTVSRGEGQNVVASAAYRSGERLVDEATDEVKFYQREILPETKILYPENAPSWVSDRQRLWNEVEKSETRVNSRLARELQIALPIELSNEQQTKLIHSFIQENCVNKGMIADVCIHRDNPENPHAHVLLTTREISEEGFTSKNRDWDKKEYLQSVREQWAVFVNKELESIKSTERIDHRSFKERGIELLPSKHIGVSAEAMERKGIGTEKKNINRGIAAYNKKIIALNNKREELRSQNFSEKVLDKDKRENRDMVVSLRQYLTNQRDIRIAFNKVNYYKSLEKKYQKVGKKLSDLELSYLQKAQAKLNPLTTVKFDYIKHATEYIGKNSMFAQYAIEFGNYQGEKIAKARGIDFKENPKLGKRFEQELVIRFANKIQDLQTDNFKTIVTSVEADYHFDKVKWTLRGWTDYANVCKKIVEIEATRDKLLEDMKGTTLAPEKEKLNNKFAEVMTSLSSLDYVKHFYEDRAKTELTRRGMFDLLEKYDNPNYQIMTVKLYESLATFKGSKVSALDLETRVFNDLKLEKAQRLSRSSLDGLSIQKRMDSYNSWEKSLERQERKLLENPAPNMSKEQINEKLSEVRDNLLKVSENKKTLSESENIQRIRLNEFLKERPEVKAVLNDIRLKTHNALESSLTNNEKLKANYGLEKLNLQTDKEIIGKVYDNILSYKEHQIEYSSKQGLRKNEYENYHAIVSNLDNYKRELAAINPEEIQEKRKLYNGKLEMVEQKIEERQTIEKKPALFTTKADKQKLVEIERWMEEREITAKNTVGATKQFNYHNQQAIYAELQLKQLESMKIPALENMKIIREQQAIREVEKAFSLNPSIQYNQNISEEQKAIFVKYTELKNKYGLEDTSVDKLREDIEKNTTSFKEVMEEIKELSELTEQHHQKMINFNNLVNDKITFLKSASYETDDKQLNKYKEEISELYNLKKSENQKSQMFVKELAEKTKEKRAEAESMRSKIDVGKHLGKMLDGMKQKYSDAQMDSERRKRLKGLQNEETLELKLRRE